MLVDLNDRYDPKDAIRMDDPHKVDSVNDRVQKSKNYTEHVGRQNFQHVSFSVQKKIKTIFALLFIFFSIG